MCKAIKKDIFAVSVIFCAFLAVTSVACLDGGTRQNGLTADSGTIGSNILIAYFSATGSTQNVAGYIAEATGGTLFELVPVNEYSSADLNYNNISSRVYQEYMDESLRDIELVSTAVDDWESYDVVFIGYPIWWQIAAWPVNNFVKDNDFTGKTVIPFCTSASSGIGQSGELLA